MRFRTLAISVAITLITISSLTISAAAWQKKPARPKADPISGDWNTSLVTDSNPNGFTLTMKLKLDGDKVTGSYESDHVGAGKISKGLWGANKLSLSLETNHGLIALTGVLKQGKLAGKFDAGQMQGKWKANKKNTGPQSGK